MIRTNIIEFKPQKYFNNDFQNNKNFFVLTNYIHQISIVIKLDKNDSNHSKELNYEIILTMPINDLTIKFITIQ